MLTELRIRNLAVIDRLSVELGPGLNVLTGETGAGKSVIVGALSLLLGERASSDLVRVGSERATVEGVFSLNDRDDVAALLDEHGIEDEDGVLLLKREVSGEGRSRAWANGSTVTAGVLRELGRLLVDLHGQHEHQSLIRSDEQRVILDSYAGASATAISVAEAHRALVAAAREVEDTDHRRRESAQRADFLRFQLGEIEAAKLRLGEEEEMDEEANRLTHAEELSELATALGRGVGGDGAVLRRLASLRRTLDGLVRIDPSLAPLEELYDTAYYSLEELASRATAYGSAVEHDPDRLTQIRERQDLLYRLRAKYGPSLAEVIETAATARAELTAIEGAADQIAELKEAERVARTELGIAAARLSRLRAEAAAQLAGEVSTVLPELGMADGHFEVALTTRSAGAGPTGAEEVEFRVSLNRGFEPRALAQVASGGEMSRVMLALKTILARLDRVPTLVFDEVDAGIGGRVGLQVGDKMREVAADHQVLAITHLAQIAARAHQHLKVEKAERGGITATEVRRLAKPERVTEIARMLGGDAESAASLRHARELLGQGKTRAAAA